LGLFLFNYSRLSTRVPRTGEVYEWATRTPRCTSHLSSICCSDDRCGSRRWWPDDGRTAAVPSSLPRRTPPRHPAHSDGRWPSILGVSGVAAGPARTDDEEQGPRRPTSPRSCLSRSPGVTVVVVAVAAAAAAAAVAAAVAACPEARPTTAASSPSDSRPSSRPRWRWCTTRPGW